MGRRRFSEREVIETLIYQGVDVRCTRCKNIIELSQVPRVEREHIHELALGGNDVPANCIYSHGSCHAIITNGTPATTAGSSKHRIAKTRGNRAEKFAVHKLRLDKKREPKPRYGNTTFRSTPR